MEKDGYSKGIINLEKGTNLYVYTGGQGSSNINGTGGFNGGGNSRQSNGNGWNGGSGGGATDIRIGTDSLHARIIVAGGGGGLCHWNLANAGNGGGLQGTAPSLYEDSNTAATSGSQIKGGILGYYSSAESNAPYTQAEFGKAGNFNQSVSGNYEGAGGGGGWYGGGSGCYVSAGGGSGWIYTESTFNTWKTGNPTDAAGWLLNSSYYLTDAQTIAGDTSMPTHDGTSTMTGNSGNGYAKITFIDE